MAEAAAGVRDAELGKMMKVEELWDLAYIALYGENGAGGGKAEEVWRAEGESSEDDEVWRAENEFSCFISEVRRAEEELENKRRGGTEVSRSEKKAVEMLRWQLSQMRDFNPAWLTELIRIHAEEKALRRSEKKAPSLPRVPEAYESDQLDKTRDNDVKMLEAAAAAGTTEEEEVSASVERLKKSRHDVGVDDDNYDDAKMSDAARVHDNEWLGKNQLPAANVVATTQEECQDKAESILSYYDYAEAEELFFTQSDSDLDEYSDEDDCELFERDLAEYAYASEVRNPLWGRKAAETNSVEEEMEDDVSGCLDALVCNVYQHRKFFRGLPFFELYKLIVKFNDKKCTSPIVDGELCGEFVKYLPRHGGHLGIEGDPEYENPYPISYYNAKADKPDVVSLGPGEKNKYIILPLCSPNPRPAIHGNAPLTFDIALKINGEDVFKSGEPHWSPDIFGCGVGPTQAETLRFSDLSGVSGDRNRFLPQILRRVLGDPNRDPLLVCAKYAVYHGAWASIKVKMLKKGVHSFYGVIMARPCIFYSRIRLLTIYQDSDDKRRLYTQRADKGEVGKDSLIKLTRSVVAVPSYSFLIIGADLYDDNGTICSGRTCFPSKESGEQSKIICKDDDPILEVSVEWKCSYGTG